MISFHPNAPFPLIEEREYSYSDAQVHSAAVDSWLGLNTETTEKNLAELGCRNRAPNSAKGHQELWIGLALKSLLTPYIEIRNLLSKLPLREGQTIVDLGAGYGRMGFVILRHFKDVNFVGYEYVGERVREGNRALKKWDPHGLRIKLVHADLSAPDFTPTKAQYYFIYDYGAPKAIDKTLHDLRRIAKSGPIVVVGRGRASRDIIERHHPWLSHVVRPIHGPHYSIYASHYELGLESDF